VHRNDGRKPMKTEHPSVCPLDCPDTCSLTVTVEDERIVSIRGSRANPYTAGVLCAKVPEAYPGFVHGEGRLKTPLRRAGAGGEGRGGGRLRADLVVAGARHRPRALHGRHGRPRRAGDPAAELRRPPWHARRRLDGPSLLPSPRRQPARPPSTLWRHSHGSVG